MFKEELQTIEMLGVVSLLENYLFKEEIELNQFFEKHLIDKELFKKTLKQLKELKVIDYYQDNDLFLITLLKKQEVNNKDILETYFGLEKSQAQTIYELSKIDNQINHDLVKQHLCGFIKKNALPVLNLNEIEIKDSNDLKSFLISVNLQDVFLSHQISFTCKSANQLYDLLLKSNLDGEVFKLLIDYTIKTNSYGNFNYEYFIKTFETFNKINKISFEEVLNRLQRKSHRYQEPTWEEMKTKETTLTQKEEEELNKWLENQ